MAGFFGLFDDAKEGPGIPKNAPPKPRAIVFFEVYFRKFWHLAKLNILFFLFNLPALILMPFIVQIYFPNLTINAGLQEGNLDKSLLYFALGGIFLCIPVLTVGPAQAGFTYVLRNFAREEHAFLWGDFKEHALKNLKQSMMICLIDILAILIMGVDLNVYLRLSEPNLFLSIITGLSILLFLIFVMMHLYIYPMLVTFKLSTIQLYRNAFIFAVFKFFPNLGILAICAVLAVLPIVFFPLMGIVLSFLITYSTIGLMTNFYVYPKLVKYIINK